MIGDSLQCAVSIADVRSVARRRLPKMAFDFVDGGADDEVTERRNRAAFEDVTFHAAPWHTVATPDLSTTVAGDTVTMPVLLAPCGGLRLVNRDGERGAAAAAGRAGVVSVLSTMAQYSIEEVAASASGPLWFQIHPVGGDASVMNAVDRAIASGYRALVIMVDSPVAGSRERDVRNGVFALWGGQPSALFRMLPQIVSRPGWTSRLLQDRIPTTFPNVVLPDGQPMRLGRFSETLSAVPDAWRQIAMVRARWGGPLYVKGVIDAEGARRALDAGASGVIVSNHGGRQLDGLPSSLSRLPEVIDAVGPDVEVLVDGGFRRGTDVVKALCLGARAVLVGRPYVYGLGAGGEQGVDRVLGIFRNELVRTLQLLGCRSVADLEPRYVDIPRHWTTARTIDS